MATPIESHVECKDCGSSDALTIYERDDGSMFSLCYSCEAAKTIEEVQKSTKRISKVKNEAVFNTGSHKGWRSVTVGTMQYFNVRVVGTDIYYPYVQDGAVSGFKVRSLKDKEFYIDGSLSNAGLFGQDKFPSGGKALTICEGELDALSAFQMAGSKYPTVSIKNGVKSAVKDCQSQYDWIDSFETIYVCFDADEPGQKAAQQVAELFGGKAKIMKHLPGMKDANDYLEAGRAKEFIERWWQSELYEPDGVLCTADLWDVVSEPLRRSPVDYPYSLINKLTYGIRHGELVTVAAGSGLGKSQFLRELVWHIFSKTEDPIGMLFLEDGKRKTVEALMTLVANKPLHLPREFESEEERAEMIELRRQAFDHIHGSRRLYLYDYFGSDSIEHIVSKLRHMVKAKGCKYLFLDHVTMLVSSQEYGDERKALDAIMTKLRMFVQETNVSLFIVSHLKRPNGTGHEEGAVTSMSQLRGSGGIGQLSDIVIGLERNAQADNEEERNTTHIRVLKNRFCGLTGPAGDAVYSLKTGRMLERIDDEL